MLTLFYKQIISIYNLNPKLSKPSTPNPKPSTLGPAVIIARTASGPSAESTSVKKKI